VIGINPDHTMDRMKSRVQSKAAENAATAEVLAPESLEDRFKALETEDKVELLLSELKSRHPRITDGSAA
jgi:phosphoenolpyruvate carboxylase